MATFGPDLSSSILGGYIVAAYWAMHTALYRLDHSAGTPENPPHPTALLP